MQETRWIATVLVGLGGLLLLTGFGPRDLQRESTAEQALNCAHCHTCAHPTAAEPCLKPFDCPRHLVSAALKPDLGPAVVILDDLERLYVPVRFDHAGHAAMAEMNGGCAICHHYTPPNLPHPSCRECHPAEIASEDLAQPGLKGAYHRQCLGCHVEWDKETKCEICHEKKADGPLHGTATTFCTEPLHEPMIMKDLIVFETEFTAGDQVPFHHRNHVVKYGADCSHCHQKQSCASCHVLGAESHPMGDPAEVDLHETCYVCHDESRGGCEQCHGRAQDDLFRHADTGWPLKTYHSAVHCAACHARQGARFTKPNPACASCHPNGWDVNRFQHGVTGVVLDDVHAAVDCADCHTTGIGSAATCTACHDDERTYNPRASFGPAGS
ncbi:MAG: cytochrome c3 family protein [Candidatus Krumholzibacteriia bacterium]